MRWIAIVFLCFALSISSQAQTNESKADDSGPQEEFEFTARLDCKDNDLDCEIKSKVTAGVPFMTVAPNKRGGIKLLSGQVHLDGKEYRVFFTFFYGTTASNNLGLTGNFNLELDKPLGIGICGGLCQGYTFILTRMNPQ